MQKLSIRFAALSAAAMLAIVPQAAKAEDMFQNIRWMGECTGFYNAALNYPYLENREGIRRTALAVGQLSDKIGEMLDVGQDVTHARRSAEAYYAKQQITDVDAYIANFDKMASGCMNLTNKVVAQSNAIMAQIGNR